MPGQTAADRPDLVVHVFHAKVTQLLKDLEKHGIMGHTVARVWTIEFQKRGLPHMHLLFFWLLNTSFELLKILTHSSLLSFQMSRNSLSSMN